MTTSTTRRLPLQIKAIDGMRGTFRGLGAAFGNKDQNGDIIEFGAFRTTLRDAQQRKAATGARFLFPLLWMHSETDPIGGVISAEETRDGLAIEAMCDLNTELGRTAFSGVQMGYTTGLSIGYNTVKATRDAKSVRHLTEVKLWEISLITSGYAANPKAAADPLSVKRNDTTADDDWRNQRPLRARPTIRSRIPTIPAPPLLKDYPSARAFEDAWNDWRGEHYFGMAPTSLRREDPLDPHSELVAFTQLTQTREELDAALVAQQDARAARPGASLSDLQAYYTRHGHLPDGRTVPDITAQVEQAHQATLDRLRDPHARDEDW